MRSHSRLPEQLRPLTITPHTNLHAEGSVTICQGNTHILVCASVEHKQPPFLRQNKKMAHHGWVTAEYAMLPRATHTRTMRDANRLRRDGRAAEIQRLIGRSLRTAVDLAGLGAVTITVDCDVLQADGGTRCAAITGGYVALALALRSIHKSHCLRFAMAAVAVGVCGDAVLVDLDYAEDAKADADVNVVMNEHGDIIELQGTAEKQPFAPAVLQRIVDASGKAIGSIIDYQQSVLASA